MHQSFVTTAPPPTGNSGGNDFSSITALLKALYCGDLLRVIALLFIRVNSTGYIYVISQAQHLPGTAGEPERSLPRTLAPLSPAHPRRWGGRGYKWLVHKQRLFIKCCIVGTRYISLGPLQLGLGEIGRLSGAFVTHHRHLYCTRVPIWLFILSYMYTVHVILGNWLWKIIL